MDHCGKIGMLREDIPIVASPESIVIMKGMQDTGVSSLETDYCLFLAPAADGRPGPLSFIYRRRMLPG
jgi:hypothetical protein